MWTLLASLNGTAMIIAWIICTFNKRAGLVDAVWSLLLALNTMIAVIHYDQSPLQLRLFLGIASSLWFLRLGIHLLQRYLSESQEDSRYATMRNAMGRFQHLGFFLFFILQAGFVLLFIAPIMFILQAPTDDWNTSLNTLLALAGILFVIAFLGESLADRQLHNFKRNPDNKGKTMDKGLWRYSRHPNYFFEWLHWFIYPIIGIAAGISILWIYPVLMFVFLYYFTGIPFSEKQAVVSRGDNYREYQRKTPVFFPWQPKEN